MKKLFKFLISFFSIFILSQKREMGENFSKHNFDKTIEIAKEILKSEPDDFETILMVVRAENEKGNFKNAVPYLEKAKTLMKEDWQKSWTIIETAKNNFGVGNLEMAKQNYNEALKINGTKNSMKNMKYFGMLTGLDEFYKNWKVKESTNIIFHFENGINEKDMERIVVTRQKAFDEINSFFKTNLPKKIDFFVWNMSESFNPVLNINLGFSNPIFSVSHNRFNQTPGHEIAHNISFWRNKNTLRTQLINEGIGVCFDRQDNEKLGIAQKVYKKNPVDIKEIWKNNLKINDDVLYPIAGAFVEYLIKYDEEKFLKLTEKQTYENASKLYDGKIDEIIENFKLSLNN